MEVMKGKGEKKKKTKEIGMWVKRFVCSRMVILYLDYGNGSTGISVFKCTLKLNLRWVHLASY